MPGQREKSVRVLVMMQRGWAQKFGAAISSELRARGAILSCITIKKSTYHWVMNNVADLYDSVHCYENVLDDPNSLIQDRRISIKEIADNLGVKDVFWYFYERNLDRRYDPKRYYAYRPNLPDEMHESYMQAVFWMAADIFERFKPTMIIGPNIVGPIHYILYLLARKSGIKFVYASETKVRGVYFFTSTPNVEDGAFFDEFENQRNQPLDRSKAREWIEKERSELHHRSLSRALTVDQDRGAESISTFYRRIRNLVVRYKTKERNINKTRHVPISIDDESVIDIVTRKLSHHRNIRDARNFPYSKLPSDRGFAFFPLQFQPEQSIDNISRYYSNQLETLRLGAMSLPDGLTLVVKEHPQMLGKNSKKYYEKIASARNVCLVDPYIDASKLIELSECVVAPTGTVLFEAALLNRPGVQLGDYGLTKRLPNVIWCDHFRNLPNCILRAKEIDFESRGYQEQLEAYVQAALNVGFRSNYFDAWEGSATPDDNLVARFVAEVQHEHRPDPAQESTRTAV